MDNKAGNILVIDDDLVNLKLVELMLSESEFQVHIAVDAVQARFAIESQSFDLILLDLVLPDADGIALCSEFKHDDRFRDIPVIFVTGYNDLQNMIAGFEAGGVDFISKPFRREELLARVKAHTELFKTRKVLREKVEEVKKISLARDKFYNVIAHDMRTPFSNISMLISLLDEGYLEPGSEDFVEIIQGLRDSVNDAFFLIENLLDWTRINNETLKVHPSPMSVTSLVQQAVGLTGNALKFKNLHLQNDTNPEHFILADTRMMKSIFRNLLSNALKFTPRDGTISITSDIDECDCYINLRDNGTGMDQETIDRILEGEMYHSSAGTEGERGSGIGLQIVTEYLRMNKGAMEITSRLGEGTSVTIRLPQAIE